MGVLFFKLIAVLALIQLFHTTDAANRNGPRVAVVFKGYSIVPNVTSSAPQYLVTVVYNTADKKTTINAGTYTYTDDIVKAPVFYLSDADDGAKIIDDSSVYSFLIMSFDGKDLTKSYVNWCVDNLQSEQLKSENKMKDYLGSQDRGVISYDTTSKFGDGYKMVYFLIQNNGQGICSNGDRNNFPVKNLLESNKLFAGNAVEVYLS